MKKAMIEIMKKLSQTAGGKKMTPKQLEDRFSQVNPASANRSLETLKKAGLVSQDIKPFGKKKGGEVKQMKKGGKVSSCSKRADGCAIKGKTKGKMI